MEKLQISINSPNQESSNSNQQSNLSLDQWYLKKYRNVGKKESKQSKRRREKLYRKYVSQFVDKYFISISNVQLERFLDCIQYFRLRDTKLAGIRELTASIFYFFYSDLIEIPNTREFCTMNNLANRIFNKQYKKCFVYFNKVKMNFREDNHSPQVKNQQIQAKADIKQQFQGKLEVAQHDKKINSDKISALNILDTIFDDLLRKPQFQENRREIIVKIAEISEKYEYMNAESLKQVIVEDLRIVRLLYIIYYNFKKYGVKRLHFRHFKEVAQAKLHTQINREEFYLCQKIFKKYDEQVQKEQDICKKQPIQRQEGQYYYY